MRNDTWTGIYWIRSVSFKYILSNKNSKSKVLHIFKAIPNSRKAQENLKAEGSGMTGKMKGKLAILWITTGLILGWDLPFSPKSSKKFNCFHSARVLA